MANLDKESSKILEKYRKIAPLFRVAVGGNTPEATLTSIMIYQLEKINENLEKLLEQKTKVEEKVGAETIVEAPKAGAKPLK